MSKDFPILEKKVHGKRLVYLDNAASTQKPEQVLAAMDKYYREENANVSRGLHALGEKSTLAYDSARQTVAKFLGIPANQTIFTSGATDGLNFAARFAETVLKEGDEILLSVYEHHSNIVPWQVVAKKTGARVVYFDLTDSFEVDLDDFTSKLSEKTKFVCFSHVSNVLGTIAPLAELTKRSHDAGAYVVVDGAQAVGHMAVDLSEAKPDFYAFSAHKLLGPQGIGVLAISRRLLDMPPQRFGGGMILEVDEQSHTLADPPECFEAGTPNVAGAVGLAAAITYIERVGVNNIHEKEKQLAIAAWNDLEEIPGLTLFGPSPTHERAGIVSFAIAGIHPHDVAQVLDNSGIAIRSGMHCANPLHAKLNVEALNRVSFALYNVEEDLAALIDGVKEVMTTFKISK